jgi:hypothetical protein
MVIPVTISKGNVMFQSSYLLLIILAALPLGRTLSEERISTASLPMALRGYFSKKVGWDPSSSLGGATPIAGV